MPVIDREFTVKPRILFSARNSGTDVHVAICSSDSPSVVFLDEIELNAGDLT